MIKINTRGGKTYECQEKYQDALRAIHDVSCQFLVGKTRDNRRVIIPLQSLDSVEEVKTF